MIRVLLVDDSAVIRRMFAQLLTAAADIEVVGEAGDPFEARDRIVELEPDVLLLDVEMPKMDGITFLRRLMYYRPTPVIVCSSLTSHGGEVALAAIQAGAVEVLGKPNPSYPIEQLGPDLVAAVRIAATAHPRLFEPPPAAAADSVAPRLPRTTLSDGAGKDTPRLIAIGASTGGVVAIETVLRRLPAETPAVVIAQHMPPYMTKPFAERLSKLVPMHVEEARDGVPLRSGSAWVAPGGKHLSVVATGNDLRLRVREGPRVNGHRPSVDVLFHSVAELATPAVGVLLTGMGRDGARGLLAMRQSGAATFAQDEDSSVVWGMPKAALELAAVDGVLPLDDVARAVLEACRTGRRRRARPECAV